ncbi:MAG: UDP-N-acetylmuramoyl-L-alanine--D-glutamate ligase [bacterium]
MVELIRKKCTGKSILILGFGREGQSSYAFLRKLFPGMLLTIADKNPAIRENPLVSGDPMVFFKTGEEYLNGLNDFDLVFRSPGITLWNLAPPVHRERITSQTDLFLQAYGKQVIGVTGTKGKSTTASLICHILKEAGEDALLAGNIGNPAFHFSELINPSTRIVYELSSHQLEYIDASPRIAILLNFFQEHLDAYASYESYRKAKWNISRFQGADDYFIYNGDDPLVKLHLAESPGRGIQIPFSQATRFKEGAYIQDGWIFFGGKGNEERVWKIHQDRFLRGDHNLKNILAAVDATMILKIAPEFVAEGIATFKGLEHRLEYVGEYGQIHFYNDSIATIPEACIEAVKAIPGVDTLIVGGFDRGIDYTELAVFISRSPVRNLILVGAAGRRVGEAIEGKVSGEQRIFFINRFDDFREIAFRETKPGHVCLLSPAAASYDEFNNFEERGKRFRELIKMTSDE